MLRQPPRLRAGDKVAIVSLSSGMAHLFPWVYEQGLKRIKEVFQLEPVEFPTARQSSAYLSANPKARANDINAAFGDPSIKAIIATIGGNDQVRILPHLDRKLISANPKIFMGYSDCTNLHLFLWNIGLQSYYGGAVMTQFAMGGQMHDYTIDSIKKALFCPQIGEIHAAKEWTDVDLPWDDPENRYKVRPLYESSGWLWHNCKEQVIEGTLWGGCLEMLDFHLSIRKYLPEFDQLDGMILFLETSEEMPSSAFVYRFFAALAEIGILKKCKAILMGYPKAQFCDQLPPEGREAFIKNQQEEVKNALKEYEVNIPIIFHMNFGHTDPQLIIPSGGCASINCKAKTIRFL